MTNKSSRKFIAVVLAGDRTGADPVAIEAGTLCKAIAPVANQPMIIGVLDALQDCELVSSIILCGPPEAALDVCPELAHRVSDPRIRWVANRDSPSKSVEFSLTDVEDEQAVLVTTADHALLSSEIVAHFLQQSLSKKVDATFGLVDYQVIQSSFPHVRRTVIKLQDGQYCGCNLFAFMNAKGRKLVPFWRKVEQKRKRPWLMVVGIMGLSSVLSYLLGKLSLDRILGRLSDKLDLRLDAVLMPYPQVGIDVDTPEDRKFVEQILSSGVLSESSGSSRQETG